MAEKKLLTYEGLEEYNIKWHERLQAMEIEDEEIDDIINNEFLYTENKFVFTVDVSSENEDKKTGIPFSLYVQPDITLTVDWGDGTTSTLTQSDYSSDDLRASTHLYSEYGIYTVTVKSSDWNNTYWMTISDYDDTKNYDDTDLNAPLYWWRQTLTSIDYPLPPTKGIQCHYYYDCNPVDFDEYGYISDNSLSYVFAYCHKLKHISKVLFKNCSNVDNFSDCFFNCDALESLPSNLFNTTNAKVFNRTFKNCSELKSLPKNLFPSTAKTFNECFNACKSIKSIHPYVFQNCTNATDFGYVFNNCTKLDSIPFNLFFDATSATNFSYCFNGCASLLNFRLAITSPNVIGETKFINNASNVTRIVCVPANSTTYTKFSSFANQQNNLSVFTSIESCQQMQLVNDVPVFWLSTIDGVVDLSINQAYSFEPEGYGIKTISIQNGSSASSFWLKLIDGGNFPIEWDSNIVWESGSEPELIAFEENIFYFYKDNGKWIGDIIATNAIEEYWKFTIRMDEAGEYNAQDFYPPITGNYTIDWDDPDDNTTTGMHSAWITSAEDVFTEYKFPYHEYRKSGLYHIKLKSSFSSAYIVTSNGDPEDFIYNSFPNIVSIESPLPKIKGSFQYVDDDKKIVYDSIDWLFRDYINLESIPDKILYHNPEGPLTFCFGDCNSLKNIPPKVFDRHTTTTDFYGCFENCFALTSVPAGLFDKNTAATDFRSCFSDCKLLQSIPAGLFDKNTAVTDFSYCFSDCSSLQSIPSGLFDKNTAALIFSGCFSGCSSLQSIPTGLFDKNTATLNFSGCFSFCSSLQSIPAGLFAKNTAATNFGSCFRRCTSIASIPSGIFNNNTLVTTFYECFAGCSSLQSIPVGLFNSNTVVTSFKSCFISCTSLQSIPTQLFNYNTSVTDFAFCFSGCTSLQGFTINIGSTKVSACNDFVAKKAGVSRIVKVPSGSTTQAKFNSVASSLGLTIQTL